MRRQFRKSADRPKDTTNAAPVDLTSLKGVFCEVAPELQRAVAATGYSEPTPIQKQCIKPILDGRDLIGCAQTGTGKTAAFALPMLQRLAQSGNHAGKGMPRALILAPTRELAGQIADSLKTYGRFMRLRHTVIFGGVSQKNQVYELNRGVDIVVATPGRLLDLMNQGLVKLEQVEIFALDEVDRMLDMGFIPDVKRILAKLPEQRQTVFFSATMPEKVATLISSMSRDAVRINVSPEAPTVEKINQKVMFVQKTDKDKLLFTLLKDSAADKVIVFTQMKYMASRVEKRLAAAGVKSVSIHGDKNQSARVRALEGFKNGRYRVLVATDVAARGLDVDDITHVVNYDIPVEAETYVHRIGRTARAGADGAAISFCCADDGMHLRQIDLLLGDPVPSDHDHEFHCDTALRSRQPMRRTFRPRGRRGSGGGGRRRR